SARLFDPDPADETTPADCRTYDHEKDLATLRRYDFFQCFPMEVDQSPELLTHCHLLADLDLRTEESCLARAHPDKPVESARRGEVSDRPLKHPQAAQHLLDPSAHSHRDLAVVLAGTAILGDD